METRDIAITIDEKFVQHACVMLESLREFNKQMINLHILYNDTRHERLDILKKHFSGSSIQLFFYKVDVSEFSYLPIRITDHVTISTYFRLLLPEILKDIDSVLFLDCDILINGDLTEVLAMELDTHAIAAVKDVVVDLIHHKKQDLGIPDDKIYFNAGILKMDLKKFRQREISKLILDKIKENPGKYDFWDQDALNEFFKGEFLKLGYKYNVQSELFFSEQLKNDPDIADAVKKPVIVHFCGNGVSKPWFYHNFHPSKHLYYQYLSRTPFYRYKAPDTPPYFQRKFRSFARKIKRALYH